MAAEYKSKQVAINKPDWVIYESLSDFSNFTPIVQDKVEDWYVEGDVCSFKVQGFTMSMKMVHKEPSSLIKISNGEGIPLEFHLWIQLKQVAEADTRMRITMHAELNMMMKMMLGNKLQEAVNKMAEAIAEAFNRI